MGDWDASSLDSVDVDVGVGLFVVVFVVCIDVVNEEWDASR